MRNSSEKVSSVSSQSDLAEFVKELADEFSRNPAGWENNDLESFLRSMSSWIEDMDSYYRNTGQPYDEMCISWKNFADILVASTMYE